MITFNEDHLSEDIAYIVENDLLLHAVNKQVEEKPSVKVIYNAKVEDIVLPKTDNGDAKIKLQSGEEFTSKLLVNNLFITLKNYKYFIYFTYNFYYT